MRYDTNSRNSRRTDFEQFTQFLGLNNDRRVVREELAKRESVNNTSEYCPKSEKSLAMVYPVKQNWSGIYDPEIGLINGTIFEELNKPFYPTACSNKNTEGCLR